MINEEYKEVGLYDHNASSYKEVKASFDKGEEVVGIVHATGTGKSYNALQLAYDNKDKKIVYIVPSNSIIEHIKKIINDNPNLDMDRDFSNLEFRTYYSFISLSREEIKNIDCDLLILDEFHHIGAPVWGARVNTMIETHPNTKIFGMTAYTVRDRGTSYERDMANPDTDELFSRKIVSRYDLCDAMIDGVLPKPIYKSAYTNLLVSERELEEKVQKLNTSSKEYQEYMTILSDVKRRIHEAPSIPNILKKSIKPNGKYIYFCPPFKEEGTNDIETIKKEALNWFKEFITEEDIVIYTTTSQMGEEGKKNRDAFYDDVSLDGEKVDNKLRVMFAINQYNEGVHAPNIDGVIMGRGTTSDIVYFEQLGRALSVRGNTKEQFEELEKHSLEELMAMCKYRDIPIKENDTKEDLINKLIAPVVIDLTNNYEFIKELENNLKDKIKEIQSKGPGNHRDIKIRDASFDIEIENQDLFETLRNVFDRLAMTWEDYYELAKAYYEHHGDLLIPSKFKTNDGYTYDENGNVKLGMWISTQRNNYSKLSQERQELLKSIGFIFNVREYKWQKNYKSAKAYYERYGNLYIAPFHFYYSSGREDELDYRYRKELDNLNYKFTSWSNDHNRKRNLCSKYNIDIAKNENVIEHISALELESKIIYLVIHNIPIMDDNGVLIDLFSMSSSDIQEKYGIATEKIVKRYGYWPWNFNQEGIDILFSKYNIDIAKNENVMEYILPLELESKVEYLKTHNIPIMDDNGVLIDLFSMSSSDMKEKYDITTKEIVNDYYNKQVEKHKKRKEELDAHGGSRDAWGDEIRSWLYRQRKTIDPESEKGKLLSEIGVKFEVKTNNEEISNLCSEYNIDTIKNKKTIEHITVQELQSKAEYLKAHNISIVNEDGLLIDIFTMSSSDMKEKYNVTLEELINEYYINKQKGKGV